MEYAPLSFSVSFRHSVNIASSGSGSGTPHNAIPAGGPGSAAKDAPAAAAAPLNQDHIVNHIKGLLNELALGTAAVADPDPASAAVSDLGEGGGLAVAHVLEGRHEEGQPLETKVQLGDEDGGGDVTAAALGGAPDDDNDDDDVDSDYDAKTDVGAVLGMFISRPGIDELNTERAEAAEELSERPPTPEKVKVTTKRPLLVLTGGRNPYPGHATASETTTAMTSSKTQTESDSKGVRPHSEVMKELLAKTKSSSEGIREKQKANVYSGKPKPHSEVMKEFLGKKKGSVHKPMRKHSDVVNELLFLKKHNIDLPQTQTEDRGPDSQVVQKLQANVLNKSNQKKKTNNDEGQLISHPQLLKTKNPPPVSVPKESRNPYPGRVTASVAPAVTSTLKTQKEPNSSGTRPHSDVVKELLAKTGSITEGSSEKKKAQVYSGKPKPHSEVVKEFVSKDKSTVHTPIRPHSDVVNELLFKNKHKIGQPLTQTKENGPNLDLKEQPTSHASAVQKLQANIPNKSDPKIGTNKDEGQTIPHSQIVQQLLKRTQTNPVSCDKECQKNLNKVKGPVGPVIPHAQIVQRLKTQGIKSPPKGDQKGTVPHSQILQEVRLQQKHSEQEVRVQQLLAEYPENEDLKQLQKEKGKEKVTYKNTSPDFGGAIKLSLKEKFASTTRRPPPLLTIDPDDRLRKKPEIEEILANSRPQPLYHAITYNSQTVDRQVQTLKDIVGVALNDDDGQQVETHDIKDSRLGPPKHPGRYTATTRRKTTRPTTTSKPTKKATKKKASSSSILDKNNKKKVNKFRQNLKEKLAQTTKRPARPLTTTQKWSNRPIWPARTTGKLRTTTASTTTTTTTTEATTRIEVEVSSGDPGVLSRMVGMVDSFKNNFFSFFSAFLGKG